MNQDKKILLLGLLARLPANISAALIPEFETMRAGGAKHLPFDEIIELLEKNCIVQEAEVKFQPSLSRAFFEPFEALFENADTKLLPGSIDRKILTNIWVAISSKIDPMRLDEIETKHSNAILRNDLTSRSQCGAMVRDECLGLQEVADDPEILSEWDSAISKVQSVRFYNLLKVENKAREHHLCVDLDLDVETSSPESVYTDFFKALEDENVNWAADFALLLMANSAKPWHVMRFFKSLAKGTNDRKLSLTALNTVGERLLATLDRMLDEINARKSTGDFDGVELAAQIEEYNKLNHGLEREEIMARDGPWRNKLKIIRGKAGKLFADCCENAETAVIAAYVLDRTKVKGAGTMDIPRTSSEPNMAKVQTALNFASFITAVRLFAPLAGFSGAHEKTYKVILRHSDLVRNGLITLKQLEDGGKFYEQWVDIAEQLTAEIDDKDAAKSFRRQIAA
ncbi:MAG: hypothetical protein FD163_2050 [Hyphomonadaceae bacterium]|nr:MAG: hypothetical protein FD128_369 [Hyphomonadaceae bacterium]KAF0183856.1 MAG: hypothetical protein FD163_2050 [Hyphomonadaceae bacterium]